jgi:conjugal transfer pilus assembly protein TraU
MPAWLRNALAAIALAVTGSAHAVVPGACSGQFFNPIAHTNWNDMFPITVAGMRVSAGGNSTPPLMAVMPPVCVCPTSLGFPFVGIGITYWQPLYISEVEHRPGCLSSLGGIDVLTGAFDMLAGEGTTRGGPQRSNRMQIHWFEYPLFSMLDMMKAISCRSRSGFNLAYMTEIDPLWQDETWSAIFTPESAVFANPVAQAACAVDSVASTFSHSLDPLFWCAGSWGSVYPMAGNASHAGDSFTLNNQVQAKFLARNHRMGLQMQTIGPTAICLSHPNPVWIKSQYRFNQVAPVNRRGRSVNTGNYGRMFTFPPVTNAPTQEHTVNLIWQGQQCCLMPLP